MALGTAGLALRGKGQGTKCLVVPWTDITHFVKLAKPDLPARARAWNLVLSLRAPLEVGKQSMRCVVLNASSASRPSSNGSSKSVVCKGEEADTEGGHRTARIESALAAAAPDEPEHKYLTRILAAATDLPVHESEEAVCPVEFVKAYRGVDDGQLYPLRAGLCFVTRPARTLFLPAQDIASIECSSRAASTADLVVSCGGASEVFSNIANDDLLLLRGFMKVLADARGDSGAAAAGGGEDDEEADEDYEPEEGLTDDDDMEPGEDAAAAAASGGAASSSGPAARRPRGADPSPPSKRTRRASRVEPAAASGSASGSGAAAASQPPEAVRISLELPDESDDESFHQDDSEDDEDTGRADIDLDDDKGAGQADVDIDLG